jgi:LmbE family N-acetylglucosaminyl deacetylase
VAGVLAPLVPREALRGPFLFLAAHPDDETLGASWLLRHSPGCYVVHLTDGAPRNPALRSPGAPPAREAYARLREREALAALARAGVSPQQLLTLGAVDQEATQELPLLTECLVALLKALRPSLLITHAYEGGHPDHDAAAFIAQAATALLERAGRSAPARVEMTSYHRRGRALVTGEFLPAGEGGLESTLELSGEDLAAKQEMLACYASQVRVLAALPVGWERYRAAPTYDFTRPPREGPLHDEAPGWRPEGERWRELAREALEALKLLEVPWH